MIRAKIYQLSRTWLEFVEVGQFFSDFCYFMFTIQIIGEEKVVLCCYLIRVWKIMCKSNYYLEVREFLHELDHWVKVVSV